MFLLHDWEAECVGRHAIFQYTDCVTTWEGRRTSCGQVQAKSALYSRPIDFVCTATPTTHRPFSSRRFGAISFVINPQAIWNVKLCRRSEGALCLRLQTAHGFECSSASVRTSNLAACHHFTIIKQTSAFNPTTLTHLNWLLWVKIRKYPTYSLTRGLQGNMIVHRLSAIGTNQTSKGIGKVHLIMPIRFREGVETQPYSFFNLDARLGWLGNATLRSFCPGNEVVSNVLEAILVITSVIHFSLKL
jgi:hypothetical protein